MAKLDDQNNASRKRAEELLTRKKQETERVANRERYSRAQDEDRPLAPASPREQAAEGGAARSPPRVGLPRKRSTPFDVAKPAIGRTCPKPPRSHSIFRPIRGRNTEVMANGRPATSHVVISWFDFEDLDHLHQEYRGSMSPTSPRSAARPISAS